MARKRKQSTPRKDVAAAARNSKSPGTPSPAKKARTPSGRSAWVPMAANRKNAVILLGKIRMDVVAPVVDAESAELPPPDEDSLMIRYWRDSESGNDNELLFVASTVEGGATWLRGDGAAKPGTSTALVELVKTGIIYGCLELQERALEIWLTDKPIEDDPEPADRRPSGSAIHLARVMEAYFGPASPARDVDFVPDLPWFYEAVRRRPGDSLAADADIDTGALIPKLRQYQRRAVHFMRERERNAAGAVAAAGAPNGHKDDEVEGPLYPLWQRTIDESGIPLYFNVASGRVSRKRPRPPPPARGGILADEMGLGKTVELLALISANPRPDPDEESEAGTEVTCKICGRDELSESSDAGSEQAWGSPARSWVSCAECGGYVHAEHLSYTAVQDEVFLCDQCGARAQKHGQKYRAKATMIIVPSALLRQWVQEVEKHFAPGAVKVVTYSGVRSGNYIPGRTLANAHIVITTYDALRADFNRTDPSEKAKSLRHEKRYRTIPSPLMMVEWWRVCVDEAQMVESSFSAATQMALRLHTKNRWCVTGTPVRTHLNQLHGLINFVGIRPYSDVFWWNRALLLPEAELRDLFRSCMWRTKKEDVAEELGLPPQQEVVVKLQFGPAEAFFYRRQHENCKDAARRWLDKADRSLTLSNTNAGNLLGKLTSLRQACCHPQVGGAGLRAAFRQPSGTMSMTEVVDALIRRAKLESEDAQRLYIAASNGAAACCMIRGGRELARAVSFYRESLRVAEENSKYFEMDRMQRLHIYHNYADALDATEKAIEKGGDVAVVDDLKAVGRTMRDGQLRAECTKLGQEYVAESRTKLTVVQADFQAGRVDVETVEKKHAKALVWWMSAVEEIQKDSDLDSALPQRVESELLEGHGGNRNVRTIASSIKSTSNILYVVNQHLEERSSRRKQLLERLTSLPGSTEPTAEDVLVSGNCKKCRPQMTGRICQHCKAEELFTVYEKSLFAVREKRINLGVTAESKELARSGTVNHGEGGVRLLSEVDKVLRIVHSTLKRKRGRKKQVEAILDDAIKFFEHVDLLKKEFRHCHLLFRAQKDLLSALDEVNMATMRIGLRLPEEQVADHERQYKLILEEVPVAMETYENERKLEEHNLKRKRGQLTYLASLKHLDGASSPAGAGGELQTCAICLGEIGSQFSVFPCGHGFCFECTARIVERANDDMISVPTATTSVKCPSCRTRAALAEISYVNSREEKDADTDELPKVRGSLGTKITAVLQAILQVLKKDPKEKILVFSQWAEVLEIVEAALQLNSVGFSRVTSGSKSFQQAVHRFRSEPEVSVLLLPIRSCASGLNLIEATHVFLVEPQINPAAEAQAVGRVHRIGQTSRTVVHRFLIEQTIEEKVAEVGRSKPTIGRREVKNPVAEKITTTDLTLLFQDDGPTAQ